MKQRRALLLFITIVLMLCTACGVWLHQERLQYRLNRQLIAVLEHNDTKTALTLVNAGADPNTRQTPSPLPSIKILLHQLPHSAPPTNDSPTAFTMACSFWHSTNSLPLSLSEKRPLLEVMLSHGANVNARTNYNRTALYEAVLFGRRQTVELLLQHGANVNVQDETGRTPLMFAAYHDATNIVRLLLSHGANPNIQCTNGNTALHWAIVFRDAESLVPELLAHGAELNRRNKNGLTPLQLAQRIENPDLVRLLQRGTK